MKNYFVPLIAAALIISAVVIRQKAQAQNTSPQPVDKTGATMADAAGTKTNHLESSAIFVTEIPPGYRDWRIRHTWSRSICPGIVLVSGHPAMGGLDILSQRNLRGDIWKPNNSR